MISKNIKYFCCEDISLIENYEEAVNDKTQTWCCHHRKETDENKSAKELKELCLYYNRPANELIFLTPSEHGYIHNIGKPLPEYVKNKLSVYNKNLAASLTEEERKQKYGAHLIGRKVSPLPQETRNKISNTLMGHKCHTLGKHRVYDNPEHTKFHFE